jgi:hypothetical protein
VPARADFVPVDLFFLDGSVGNHRTQTIYLTIENIGNVASSRSQQEMKITIRGEEMELRIFSPVAPGASLRKSLALSVFLRQCERVVVELDTSSDLKFQVGQGAFPNEDVFANDKVVLTARNAGTRGPVVIHCNPQVSFEHHDEGGEHV